jgi:V/A-type H+-transporting ATPase subunit I
VATFCFGIVYGELFGKLWGVIGLPDPLFHRKEQLVPLLAISLGVGVAHLIIGGLAGLTVALRGKHVRHAMVKIADLAIVVAALVIAAQMAQSFSPTVAIIGLGIALVIKVIAGGLTEIIELARSVSAILSYARIMAIGTASIIFADMADDILLGADILAIGIGGMVLVHGMNFLFGVFDPAVQALRLHYVEFFNQFYEAGAVRYDPLGKRIAPAT